ncbi:unnamed protein product [Parascedosporium putredinis]|uniref:Ankyrin repeat protein n=1 Tax=Parascedosporium putredinis TaxID=1442378 RepID=A0A9P1M7B4_9PEZI|nr:unnamed protein product [Parascedosporium putredinis]CAI7988016.1 unnamed protein product [Parascedosporium putredinis]
MLDPWNVAGVVLAASEVAWHIGIFWRESRTAPAEAQRLYDTVELLKTSVTSVRDRFLLRDTLDDAEKKNYLSIVSLVEKCEKDLIRLQLILPKADDDEGTFARLRIQFQRKLNEDNVRDIVTGITLCNLALQSELQSLSIYKMERERAPRCDHTSIQMEWEKVVAEAERNLSHRGFVQGDIDWDNKIEHFLGSLKESAGTSDGRTTVPELPQVSGRRDSRQTSISVPAPPYQSDVDSGLGMLEDLDEAQQEHMPIPAVLRAAMLPVTLEKVAKYMREGDYRGAARFQQRAILYRREDAGDRPLDTIVVCKDEMQLANIYRKMATPQGRNAAETTLLNAVDRVKTEQIDPVTRKDFLLAELYHDLGRIYIESKKHEAARTYLTDAFDLLAKQSPPSSSLIRSVGIMLYQTCTIQDNHEVAELLNQYSSDNFDFSLKALAWCQDNGFDIEPEDFCFDKRDPARGVSSPRRHRAMRPPDPPLMLKCALDLEIADSNTHRTPLLIACSLQDTQSLQLLLAHGARVDVTDKQNMNGLHLCQRSTGGTKVARCLLNHPSRAIDVNAVDWSQQTALHFAAEMGNLPMVRLLLDCGAKADIQGLGGWTPLMAAVQATSKTQEEKLTTLKALIAKGADPTVRYSSGQTAVDMANDAQIRKHLKNWSKPFAKPSRKISLSWKSA